MSTTTNPTARHSEKITVALIQSAASSDPAANLDKTVARIADAAASGADVVCLQELFASRYPCQTEDHRRFDLAEPIPGPSSERLAAAAAEHRVVLIASLFEKRAAGLYHNTAIVLDSDGSLQGRYRKMHIPDDPGYYEKFYFAPGDLGFQSFATTAGPLGVCVCWDQWFPEAARLTALAGAKIIFYPTAIGWLPEDKPDHGPSQHAAWQTTMQSHAIANGVFVAAANRTGVEEGIEFWGASFVADPTGQLIAVASHNKEETLIVECDLTQVEAVRTHWPFLRDRRIDAYEGLSQRWLGDG